LGQSGVTYSVNIHTIFASSRRNNQTHILVLLKKKHILCQKKQLKSFLIDYFWEKKIRERKNYY